MSDELNIIFNKDCSYEKKVEEVKKLANKHLEETNLYLLNSIYYIINHDKRYIERYNQYCIRKAYV